MAAPMPRAAPVTSATFPSRGRSQSIVRPESGPGTALDTAGPIRTTCPETYADFGEAKNRSVEASWSSAFGATYSSCAVTPLRTSLPSERTSPSSAR